MKNKLKYLGVAVMPKTLTGRRMKKPIMAVVTTCILVFFMSCGTTAATNGDAAGLPLFFDTIEQAADRLATGLGDGTRVAVVAFESSVPRKLNPWIQMPQPDPCVRRGEPPSHRGFLGVPLRHP